MERFRNIFDRVWTKFIDKKELETLADDLALAPSEILDLLDGRSGAGMQLEKMAEIYGLKPSEIAEKRWLALEIARACNKCSHARGCKAFLAGKDVTFSTNDCPNSERYLELANTPN